jgi:hypothetical protein
MPNIELYIFFLIVCLLLSAFFSGSETAFISLQRFHLEYLVSTNVKGAKNVACSAIPWSTPPPPPWPRPSPFTSANRPAFLKAPAS